MLVFVALVCFLYFFIVFALCGFIASFVQNLLFVFCVFVCYFVVAFVNLLCLCADDSFVLVVMLLVCYCGYICGWLFRFVVASCSGSFLVVHCLLCLRCFVCDCLCLLFC